MAKTLTKEKSCGAIVYRIDKEIEFLIIQQQSGHYGFPKGHVENNETELETALREIKEETNLDVEIDTNFRVVSTYSPCPHVIKDVVFFVAKPITHHIKLQENEVANALWCKADDALTLLTHEDNRRILKAANEYIRKKVLS